MRLIFLLFALLGLAVPAHARDVWSQSRGRITLNAARISFPLQADRLALTESKEFSHEGTSLDAIAQFHSSDRKVFATVYIYYPGISHVGFAAFATDNSIRHNSRGKAATLGSQLVAAGAAPGVAVRTDYSGYQDNLASSAAFIKAGRWMVKLRVSGPENRRGEVTGAMSALLEGVRFSGDSRPRPAALLETPTCPTGADTDAALAADDETDIAARALFFGSLDPVGEPVPDRPGGGGGGFLGSRIGTGWCKRTAVQVGSSFVPILRAIEAEDSTAGLEGKSMAFAVYSDAGGLIEIVRLAKGGKYLVLHHQIGSTDLLGAFVGNPSDAQIALILAGQSPAGRTRARINYEANGNSRIEVEAPAAVSTSPTT